MARADIYGTDPTGYASRVSSDALGSQGSAPETVDDGSKGNLEEKGTPEFVGNKGGKAKSEGN